MILASAITHMDWKNAKKVFLRDRYNHKSPNSAHTESVMAGALDVQLAGDAWYFGKLCKKPTIGDAIREIEPEDIRRSQFILALLCGYNYIDNSMHCACSFILVQ